MPGGSVNGRPFRESADSYQKTGIPCGNPRRYHSQDVVRMEAGRRSAPRAIDGPLEEIETEGQRHLRALAQRQTDTNITLHQQLSQKREFSHGAEHRPATNDLSGMVSLETYQTMEKTDGYIEEMKSYGLTEEDILLKLKAEEGPEIKRSKLANPLYSEARLREIDRKIEEKKKAMSRPDNFSNTKSLTRHEMDLERAISSTNKQNSFLHDTLIKAKIRTNSADDDPMNNLPEILKSVVPGKYNVIHPLRKSKIPKHSYKSDCTLECCRPESTHICSECEKAGLTEGQCSHDLPVATCMERPEGHNSQYQNTSNDSLEKNVKQPSFKSASFVVHSKQVRLADSNLRDDKSEQLCDTQQKKISSLSVRTSENGEDDNKNSRADVRVLDANVESIPEDEILNHKLSSEEVKRLPKFETYSPGEPSNVLYVKNLSPKVTEADLASLFIRFQEQQGSRIIFKLMTGRMKGQAFVTFPDTVTATSALQLIHGYQFKGKPVIVQFGRKQS